MHQSVQRPRIRQDIRGVLLVALACVALAIVMVTSVLSLQLQLRRDEQHTVELGLTPTECPDGYVVHVTQVGLVTCEIPKAPLLDITSVSASSPITWGGVSAGVPVEDLSGFAIARPTLRCDARWFDSISNQTSFLRESDEHGLIATAKTMDRREPCTIMFAVSWRDAPRCVVETTDGDRIPSKATRTDLQFDPPADRLVRFACADRL